MAAATRVGQRNGEIGGVICHDRCGRVTSQFRRGWSAPTGAERVAVSTSIQALNRNEFLRLALVGCSVRHAAGTTKQITVADSGRPQRVRIRRIIDALSAASPAPQSAPIAPMIRKGASRETSDAAPA